ncbi:decaprenyl-phosphate phosphoribosyltransferase [Candidatus Woesebacteria bacterium]|nr:decaprenyl-phosphate phosphoribosyltransferase [Candidatus Woesebacteria bacterium]
MRNLIQTAYFILKSARPRQWIKNFALFAALFFSGFLFFDPVDGPPYFFHVALAFIVFCFTTSAVYIVNDIVDMEADRNHPFKRKRPIASGNLSVPMAITAAVLLLATGLLFSLTLGWFFRILLITYVLMQFGYAKLFKHIPIVDVSVIATGFLIRVYAGAVVVNLHMSVWFLLTVISASLFIAVAKRQSERTLLDGLSTEEIGATRKILKHYSNRLLDQFTAMFATATWLTFALFTFQSPVDEPRPTVLSSLFVILPRTLQSQKLLMLSLPLVIFIVMRYLQLVYEGNKGESPERVLFSDKQLLISVLLFVVIVFLVTYVI